jgi:hypothetical protein
MEKQTKKEDKHWKKFEKAEYKQVGTGIFIY